MSNIKKNIQQSNFFDDATKEQLSIDVLVRIKEINKVTDQNKINEFKASLNQELEYLNRTLAFN